MATFTPQIAPSSLLKTKDATEDGPRRQTKEEYRKLKELEEARKAGTVPAMTDVETGSDINPHIPHYIAQAPWYIGAAGPTLKHQKPHPERQKELAAITQWYKRGVSDQVAQKYRKGACENCGAMTHKRKDCMERPRKIGAKYTNDSIAADEFSQPNIKLDYDAKRDRWNGFDASSYNAQAVKEFDQLEEARKKIRLEKCRDGEPVDQRDESVLGEEDRIGHKDVDEDKYAENASMPGVKLDVDSRTRITVRNLRIREDTAKYLYNLDPNSAYYDPKSRSMRDNPFKGTHKSEDEVPFAGENFHKFTGEVLSVNNAQLFAWEAHKRGASVHALAEPTKLEVLKKEYVVKKETLKSEAQKAILEKYGGEEYLQNPDKELLYAQTENYVEYNRHGAVVKGDKKPTLRSRYEEDVFVNNHTSVWGSYWSDGEWGYACCHNKFPNSYCTGEMGKAAMKSSIITSEVADEVKSPSSPSSSEHESSSLSNSEEE